MLISILAAFGIFTAAGAVVSIAFALLRPPRMTDGKAIWILRRISPGDLGLPFEDVVFNIRDEQTGAALKIAGWWIPSVAMSSRCVVFLHGYADAKVGSIAWAPLWRALGFNVLAIDLRAHGESGGVYCTAGFWERHDLMQVLDQLRAHRPDATARLYLFGVSLGAATAIATAILRDDIAAVVLESPPADFRNAAMTQMDNLGAPGRLFQRLALSLAERIAGCHFSEVRPGDLLPKIRCPVMLISPADDPMVSESERAAILVAMRSRVDSSADAFWSVSTGHLLALHAHRADYERRLGEFIENSINNPIFGDDQNTS